MIWGVVTVTSCEEALGSTRFMHISYKRHRFRAAFIAYAVWHYYRFPLSLRLVEEMLPERGIVVSYKTIRRWGKKFGPQFTFDELRRKRPSPNDVWHLDEGAPRRREGGAMI